MTDTAPRTAAAPPKGEPQVGPAAARPDREPQHPPTAGAMLRRVLLPLASLKLTVVLFALAIFLTYAGTVAQKERGIATVMSQYFRTGIAQVEIEPLLLGVVKLPASWPKTFPFPGGWLIGGVMLVNLLAAHVIRFNAKARGPRLWAGLGIVGVGLALVGLLITERLGVHPGGLSTLASPGWAIMLGIVGVLLGGATLLFNRRAGVVVAHAGLVVLLVSELITGLFAVEGIMLIMQGGQVNYTEIPRTPELVIVDHSPADHDEEIVVPGSMLVTGGTVRHPELPFDVEVVEFMRNSDLVQPGGGMVNAATAGDGLRMVARPMQEASGAGGSEREDAASAYVRILDKQTHQPAGTFLVSYYFYRNFGMQDLPQRVTVGGKSYDLYLRFTRNYQPYTVKLLEFRHEVYPGTSIPKDFSSFIQLIDPANHLDRRVRIWMNHPLRYHNQTFYQQRVVGQGEGTILQVVQNPGWAVPYISCLMVAGGLIAHFGLNLSNFLRKRAAA